MLCAALFHCYIRNYTMQKNVDNSDEKDRGMDVKDQETCKERGVIRQILIDHFHDFMDMHGHHLPKEFHRSITEPVFICFNCKSRFYHGCGKKNIRMNG